MSKILKLLGVIFFFIFIMLSLVFIYVYIATKNKDAGVIKLNGLNKSVIINRDQYGIPHIQASTDEDAYFALGYIHAQDRFWQMEFQRHIAQGTLSEMFGEATLEQDKYLRTFGFYRAANMAWETLTPDSKKIIHSYTKGINSFLEEGKLPLPFMFIHYKPSSWSDVDSIAFQKIMALDLQNTWKEKIENYVIAHHFGKDKIGVLLPPYPSNAPTILTDQNLKMTDLLVKNKNHSNQFLSTSDYSISSLNEIVKQSDTVKNKLGLNEVPGKGSNNWVVSGNLTNTHKPLLASDPHLGLSAPVLWYLADIKTPNFHSIGATIPGLPAIVIGHNDYIAWGITNGCVDVQDLYVESSTNSIKTINEIIKIKNGSDINFPVRMSVHGPIISDITDAGKIGPLVALKWPALMAGDTTMQSFIELNYAHNWQEFVNALSHYVAPSQNFIYADIAGNIGYYLPGKIPVREGWDGAFPINNQENLEWKGYIPFSKLPHVFNPPEGYISSANNPAATHSYPYGLTFRCGIAPYRAQRIEELLKKNKPLTKTDMEIIQNDTKSYLWKDLSTVLLTTKPLDIASNEALIKLRNWDGNMNHHSEAATIFAYWYKSLSKLTPDIIQSFSEWPEPLFIKQQLENNGSFCRKTNIQNCDHFLSHSLKEAITELNKSHPSHRKQSWGYVHKAYFEELGLGGVNFLGWIWNRTTASSGDAYTINVGTYHFKNMRQIEGAGYRQIIDLSNFDDSEFIQALGQSENVLNANYDNQMSLWRDGKYVTMSSKQDNWGKFKTLKLEPKV